MREIKYSEAAVEVLDILNYTNKEDFNKIPQSFIKFLTDISSKSYKVQLNHEYPINGLNLKKETRELLGFIYITWWCNKEEREKYKKLINEKNIKDEVYDINDIFKKQKEKKVVTETSLVDYKKENKFKQVLNKILKFFRKGRKVK